jgi:hypothetical protein
MSNTRRAELPPPPSSPPGSPLPFDAARAEALVGDSPVSVELVTRYGKAVVQVLPPMDWEYNAITHLRSGMINLWVQGVMTEQEFAKFDALHPTMREVLEFSQRWEIAAGQNLGKSPASQ